MRDVGYMLRFPLVAVYPQGKRLWFTCLLQLQRQECNRNTQQHSLPGDELNFLEDCHRLRRLVRILVGHSERKFVTS